MLILRNHDACYRSFMKFSPLACNFAKVEHAAACGHSDEDLTTEIKERVELTSWDRGPLIAHYVS